MQLISYLQEAADIPLSDLRAIMKKDKRVSKIFTKDLQLSEISDPKEFLLTLRYYVFNNRHVLDFAKNSGGRKLSPFWFNKARKLNPEILTQEELSDIQEQVLLLFKDSTAAQNSTISAATMKDLFSFVNYERRSGLSGYQQKELLSTPGIRPSTPVRLYRGLHFNEYSLREREQYDGKMEVGDGLKFLRSIREGSRIAELTWDDTTIWTHSKTEALKRAYDTTWMDRDTKIRSDSLGFVVSTLARPEDIMVDMKLIPRLAQWDAQPVVMKAGTYTVRVVHKFTPTGEVDPAEKPDDFSDLADMADALETFAHVFKAPFPEPNISDTGLAIWMNQPEHHEEIKALASADIVPKLVKSLDTLTKFYNTYLQQVPEKELVGAMGTKYEKEAVVAKAFHEYMSSRVDHPTEIDTSRGRPRKKAVSRSTLTGSQIYDSGIYSQYAVALHAILANVRFRDWQTGAKINDLAKVGGYPNIKDIHQRGIDVQRVQMEHAIEGFFKTFDMHRPEDRKDAVKEMATTLLRLEKNLRILNQIWSLRLVLDKLVA